MSSPTVGKGGRRKDASFLEAAIVKVNTVKNKHTHTQKVRETMIDPHPQQQSDSDAERHECLTF